MEKRPLLSADRRQSLTVVGGVLAGVGTLLAALVGLIQVFDDDGSGAPPLAAVASSPSSSPGPTTRTHGRSNG